MTLPKDLKERLDKVYENFNVSNAEALSDEIHDFEANGGKITSTEDSKWYALTCYIGVAWQIENTCDADKWTIRRASQNIPDSLLSRNVYTIEDMERKYWQSLN